MRIQFYTNRPINMQQKNADKNADNSVSKVVNNDMVIKAEKTLNYHFGSKIAIVSLTAAASIIMISRNFQKNTKKYLGKFKDYLEKKLELSSLNDSTKWTKFYNFAIQRINSFMKQSESINNLTSLKDILFMKFMYKWGPTKKLHETISNYFEKLSWNTVLKSYKKTGKKFDRSVVLRPPFFFRERNSSASK